MACRGLAQSAWSFTSPWPSKAARKIIISPRTFQVLARESRPRPPSPPSRPSSQCSRTFSRLTPSRAFHGSTRAGSSGTPYPAEQSKQPATLETATNEQRKQPETDTSRPALRPDGELAPSTLPELVRQSMRLVPQPVTVITSANTSTHPSGSPSSWHGATISSFNTVTLKPIPIISFNIKHDSSTFAAITASGRLWVHLLTTAPFASTLADGFARQRGALHPSLIAEITEGGHEHDLSGQQPPTEPIIPPGGRIAFILACHYMPDITARIGDHVVLFAEVTEVIDQSPRMVSEGRKPSKRRPCLVYADGEYQRLTPLDDPSYHNDTNDKS